MFASARTRLDVDFPVAKAKLASLAREGFLRHASDHAYGEGPTGETRVGPLGPVPGMSRLVKVRFLDMAMHGGSAVLPMRWEAAGPGGSLFPALDADITLAPAEDGGTVLEVSGVYRPPYGTIGAGLDRAFLHQVARATIRAFTRQVGAAIAGPAAVHAADNEPGIIGPPAREAS